MKEFRGAKKLNEVPKGNPTGMNIKSSYDSVEVELMQHNVDDQLMDTMFNFIMGSFGDGTVVDKVNSMGITRNEMMKVIDECLKGKALPLAMEIPCFTFSIKGIDRVTTHQLVRSRIGVVFSQHCTGDNDLRNANAILPGPIMKLQETNQAQFSRIVDHLTEVRKIYADLVDDCGISIQDARHLYPHCFETYLMMSCNYMMLRGFISRRACANETFQMNRVASLIIMKIKEIVHPLAALLANYLKGQCEVSQKCHRRVNSVFSGSVFMPCGKFPQTEEPDPEMYIHPGPPREFRGEPTDFEKKD